MKTRDWDTWYEKVRANLGHPSLSNKDYETLFRWFEDGLTIQAATINLRACWKQPSGNHPLIDYTLECLIRGQK